MNDGIIDLTKSYGISNFQPEKVVWMSLTGDSDTLNRMFIGPVASAGDVVEIVCTNVDSRSGKTEISFQLRVKEAA